MTRGANDQARRVDKLAWIATPKFVERIGRPVPLVVFSQPCRFKQRALEMLNQAQIPWEIVFKSPSLSGLWAAARANIGLTVRSSYLGAFRSNDFGPDADWSS